MTISGIINNVKVNSNTNLFHSLNPTHFDSVVATYSESSEQDCEAACKAAQEAFETWSSTPAPVRAGVISNFGKLILKNKEEISKLLSLEMGKPIREARGDVQEAIDTCDFFVSEGRRLYGQTVPSEMPNKELYTYRRPIGVFGCITAGNFPFAVPSWYFIPALITGNTCVWKPSEDTPKISEIFTDLLIAAGCPKGVFNVVFGGGATTGASLLNCVEKGLIQKVGFTGSSHVGRQIGEICGRNLQVPCLELGGKNPMVVTPSANIHLAVEGALWAAFGTAGQRCTSLGNLILHKSIKNKFMELFLSRVNELQIGDPLHEKISYSPLMSKKFLNSHLKNIETLIKPHHKVLTQNNGRITSKNKPNNFLGNPDSGYFVFPTIVDNVLPSDELYSTETFGPFINVLTYENLNEAIMLSNGTGYGLSSSIYTQDMQEAYTFKNKISAGMTSINNSTTGAEAHLPFGGNGKSGNGSRQSGIWVLDTFTKWQAVNWDFSGSLQLAQMDTVVIEAKDYTLKASQ
jgi:alpha-ketoglutaric semialdehyde dehydrogenase